MALRVAVFLLVSSLLASARVESDGEEPLVEVSTLAKSPSSAVPAPAPSPPHIIFVDLKECPKLCTGRCAKNSRQNHCNRVCNTCCQRCKCVPPGTYGNKEMCGPCYAGMTTHRNATKCP